MRLLALAARLDGPRRVVDVERLSSALRTRQGHRILSAGQNAARFSLLQEPVQSLGCSDPRSRSRALTEYGIATVALPAGKLRTYVPFEAETWGTPLEHEPEHIPVVPPDWCPPHLDKNSNWGLTS